MNKRHQAPLKVYYLKDQRRSFRNPHGCSLRDATTHEALLTCHYGEREEAFRKRAMLYARSNGYDYKAETRFAFDYPDLMGPWEKIDFMVIKEVDVWSGDEAQFQAAPPCLMYVHRGKPEVTHHLYRDPAAGGDPHFKCIYQHQTHIQTLTFSSSEEQVRTALFDHMKETSMRVWLST